MPLSDELIAMIAEAEAAVDSFYDTRLSEIDREVRNLQAYGTPINDLGDATIEAGVAQTLEILTGLGIDVA
jgi:hypothetical protein